MPKATKLHNKGKPTSLQKHCKTEKTDEGESDPEDTMRQFQLELCWCIQQLERSLAEKRGSEKQLQESWKVLTVLKNNNQPIIRKRQLMRTHFGDYRALLVAEEKKLVKLASKIKISEIPTKPKATFLRRSAFLTTGDDSFKFNFDVSPDLTDQATSNKTDSTLAQETENANNKINCDETKANGVPKSEDNSKDFKFKFSESHFKFNFDINK